MDDKADALVNQLHKLRLGFDGRRRRHIRIAALVHALDVWDEIELTDRFPRRPDRPQGHLLTPEQPIQPGQPKPARPLAQSDPGLQLITETGEVLTGYALFEKLTRSLRLLWPLALVTWIPRLASLARARYPRAAG